MANFTIDDLEIERVEESFVYTTQSGRDYTFTDPKALDGRTVLAFQQGRLSAEEIMMVILGADYDDFMDEPEVDGYVLQPLIEKWSQHFGIAMEPGKAPRSSTPSTTSPKSSKPTSRARTKGAR